VCDPISIGLGVLGGSLYSGDQARKESKRAAAQSRDDLARAAGERERVETEAVQAAQMEMARTKGRRRQSLLGSVAGSLTAPSAEGIKQIPATPPGASMLSRGASFLSS
jgi:hypothetical protein